MASMSSVDLDPAYAKCLRLLHSKSKDSEEQLRQMLEDLVRQRNGNATSIAMLQKKDFSSKKDKHSSGRKEDFKKESGKHTFEDSSTSNRETKKSKCEITKSSHLKPSSTPSPPLSSAKALLSEVDVKEDIKDEDDDDDDLALEILEEDLACVVCRGMEVGARNQLVECLECHSLYHQECHQTPVPDDMLDPRSAWYCATCTKALKKPSSARSSPKPSGSSGSRDVSPSTSKVPKSEPSQTQNPFKRAEKTVSRQTKSTSQSYTRSQPQNKQHQLQKLRKMLSPRSPSVSSDKS